MASPIVAHNGVDAAVFKVFHGQTHFVVGLHLGAQVLGVVEALGIQDARGADLAAHSLPLEVAQLLHRRIFKHDQGLVIFKIGFGKSHGGLAFGRDGHR